MKLQHTLITLADTVAIHIGEQRRRAVRQRGKQIFGLARFEPQSVEDALPLAFSLVSMGWSIINRFSSATVE
jgi:hypothetical protein